MKLKKKNAKNNSKPINWAVTLSENTQHICKIKKLYYSTKYLNQDL